MASKKKKKCQFGVNKRTKKCLKHKRAKKSGAKKRSASKAEEAVFEGHRPSYKAPSYGMRDQSMKFKY